MKLISLFLILLVALFPLTGASASASGATQYDLCDLANQQAFTLNGEEHTVGVYQEITIDGAHPELFDKIVVDSTKDFANTPMGIRYDSSTTVFSFDQARWVYPTDFEPLPVPGMVATVYPLAIFADSAAYRASYSQQGNQTLVWVWSANLEGKMLTIYPSEVWCLEYY